jgi:serine/threonine-protein kinase
MSNDTCPGCQQPVPAGQPFCGRCGSAVTDASTSTPDATIATDTRPSDIRTSPTGPGRFDPGTVIADRYRIVGLLGRGGMGEVYRADDLKLARPVALKFLPASLEGDPSRLQRLLNEVRLALSVSHPNVCRVHDVQQEAGRHFITMEFVDGEDLAALLRRIGRLPGDKALQIAQQLCAGLAAAHTAGVLHRDLKPANIMVDGRGQVKITDFGLAGLDGGIRPGEVRDGTPAYMAPEQLAGDDVSTASDLYALGLVLYEVYTGKPAYQGATPAEIRSLRSSAPTSPSSHIADIDPAVERLIMRCLEPEPRDRPGSALAVAAALPGGDPLAAALAAGETPAPGLVAEAGAVGGLSSRAAWSLLAACVLLVGLAIAGGQRYMAAARSDLPKSSAVLEEKAREILASLGYDQPFRDSIVEFTYNQDYVRHLRRTGSQAAVNAALVRHQPSLIHFGYRQSPEWLRYESLGSVGGWVTRATMEVPDEIRLFLDPTGRLVFLDVVPRDRLDPVTAVEPDWNALLTAAGLDPAELVEVAPEWTAWRGSDRRRAWEGVYPDAPDVPIRMEASALAGRVVTFMVVEPWTRPVESVLRPLSGPGSGNDVEALAAPALYVTALLAVAFFAWRNVRLRRGDQRTAVRFALLMSALRFVWYMVTHHTASSGESDTLTAHLAWTSYRFVLAYGFYLAVEPYTRKLWPRMLSSWVRLFDNRWRDPLVGRDLLLGTAVGAGLVTSRWLITAGVDRLGLPGVDLAAESWATMSLSGLPGAVLGLAGAATQTLFPFFILITIILVLRLVLRRDVLVLASLLLIGMAFSPVTGAPWYVAAVGSLVWVVATWIVLFRAGLLAFATMMLVSEVMTLLPLTFALGAWWAGPTWLVLAMVLGLAIWGFRGALAGRPVFRDEVLGG